MFDNVKKIARCWTSEPSNTDMVLASMFQDVYGLDCERDVAYQLRDVLDMLTARYNADCRGITGNELGMLVQVLGLFVGMEHAYDVIKQANAENELRIVSCVDNGRLYVLPLVQPRADAAEDFIPEESKLRLALTWTEYPTQVDLCRARQYIVNYGLDPQGDMVQQMFQVLLVLCAEMNKRRVRRNNGCSPLLQYISAPLLYECLSGIARGEKLELRFKIHGHSLGVHPVLIRS